MADIAANPWFQTSGALEEVQHPQLGRVLFPGKAIRTLDRKNWFHFTQIARITFNTTDSCSKLQSVWIWLPFQPIVAKD